MQRIKVYFAAYNAIFFVSRSNYNNCVLAFQISAKFLRCFEANAFVAAGDDENALRHCAEREFAAQEAWEGGKAANKRTENGIK